ncbi:MAG: VOC family protein [Chitinophagales bacterium]
MAIPSQYLPVMPYLILRDAKAFMAFAKDVFQASEQLLVPRGELIMHAELRIGEAVIMLADATDEFGPRPSGMFIYVENVDAVYQRAIARGSKSLMPVSDMEYGRSCGFQDSWGNQWWPTQIVSSH